MIGVIEPLNSGFVLTDPADQRYEYIFSLRRRFGEFLHQASKSLLQQGEENTVDAVEMLVSHPVSTNSWHSNSSFADRRYPDVLGGYVVISICWRHCCANVA